MKYSKLLFFLLFISILVSCTKQKLELQLEKGKNYTQILFADNHFSQNFNGQKLDSRIKAGGELNFRVKNYQSGIYDLETTYKYLSYTLILPTDSVEFNSEKKDSCDIYSTALSYMINKPFQIKMTPLGLVKEIKGLDEICEKAFERIINMNEIQKQQMKSQLLIYLGNNALRNNLEIINALYNGETVNKGERWNMVKESSNVVPQEINIEYKVLNFKKNICNISAQANIKTSQTPSQLPTTNIPVKYKLTGKMNSKILLDKSTGWVMEAFLQKKLTGNAFVMNNPQMPSGMRIPVTVESIYTVVKK